MANVQPLPKRIIWAFAVGYFFFYAPYSGMVKTITSGGRGGLEIMPGVVLGTVLGIALTLLLLGWWRFARIVREPRRMIAGIGEASLVGATTIFYTFSGVSIVLALLLMRGGVLTLAPVVDLAYRRRVRWFAWAALTLSLVSVIYALAHAGEYSLNSLVAVTLAFYLGGYMLRLPAMTKLAKVRDRECTRQYFVDEAVVLCTVLLAVTALAILLPLGTVSEQLRLGVTHMSPAAVGCGLLYAGLHLFGTMIYLDWRENTFCVPLNRCTSIFAGIVASLAVTWNWNVAAVPSSQMVAAAIMVLALLLLSPAHHVFDLILAPVLRKLGRAPALEAEEGS